MIVGKIEHGLFYKQRYAVSVKIVNTIMKYTVTSLLSHQRSILYSEFVIHEDQIC